MAKVTCSLMSRITLHITASFLYPGVVSCVLFLYSYAGVQTSSRGAAAGIATQFIFYCVAGINLLMVAIPSVRSRMVLVIFMGAGIHTYLSPVHPLRAVLLASLACAVTTLAILGPAIRARIGRTAL